MHDSLRTHGALTEDSHREGKGREGKGIRGYCPIHRYGLYREAARPSQRPTRPDRAAMDGRYAARIGVAG